MKHLAIFVATGFEDTELISALDVFNRNEISYDLFSIENLEIVKGKYEAYVACNEMESFYLNEYKSLFLPGGPGYKTLLESDELIKIVKDFRNNGKYLTAICAAPEIFVKAEVILGEKITSYPGHALIENNTGNEVEVSGKIITGRDYKATINFAEKVSEVLNGKK